MRAVISAEWKIHFPFNPRLLVLLLLERVVSLYSGFLRASGRTKINLGNCGRTSLLIPAAAEAIDQIFLRSNDGGARLLQLPFSSSGRCKWHKKMLCDENQTRQQ